MTDNTPTTKQEEGGLVTVTQADRSLADDIIALDWPGNHAAYENDVQQLVARHRLAAAPATPPHNEDGLRKALVERARASLLHMEVFAEGDDLKRVRSVIEALSYLERQALGDIPSG